MTIPAPESVARSFLYQRTYRIETSCPITFDDGFSISALYLDLYHLNSLFYILLYLILFHLILFSWLSTLLFFPAPWATVNQGLFPPVVLHCLLRSAIKTITSR